MTPFGNFASWWSTSLVVQEVDIYQSTKKMYIVYPITVLKYKLITNYQKNDCVIYICYVNGLFLYRHTKVVIEMKLITKGEY